MRNLHFENGKDMETSDKPHIQYLVQHGHIAGDVFPVYVVNDRETAIKKAKSLMLDIAESFRNGRLKNWILYKMVIIFSGVRAADRNLVKILFPYW